MSERNLEELLRMVAEVDELERAARSVSPTGKHDAVGIRFEHLRRRPAPLRLAAGVAAAAALLVVLWLPPLAPQPRAWVAPPLEVAHWPGIPDGDGVRIDCFEPNVPVGYAVLAIFHSWQQDCQCLAWQLYEWEGERPATNLSPDDVCDIVLDVTDVPPVEQFLVLAIAEDPGDLPGDQAQASELLDCLDAVVLSSDARENAAAYASAVRSCLPDSVTVVPQSFLVE